MRRRKDQKWELKGKVWQPVLKEEHVLREIMARLWLQARIKVWRVRERIPGKWAPSTPGIPDLIGWIRDVPEIEQMEPGVAIPLFIEVKRPGGVRRPAQELFIQEARSGGCCAFFAESWEDVRREMATFGVDIP